MTDHDDREAPDLLAAAQAALPALVLLGDYIGNAFAGKTGIPAFDRCAVIDDLKNAIAAAEFDRAEASGECVIDGTPIDPEIELCFMNCQPGDRYAWIADGNPPYAAEQPAEPEPQDYDPGPEIDDEGGMSEYRHEMPGHPF